MPLLYDKYSGIVNHLVSLKIYILIETPSGLGGNKYDFGLYKMLTVQYDAAHLVQIFILCSIFIHSLHVVANATHSTPLFYAVRFN